MSYEIICGDVCEKLAELADGSVDSIVTDPPYGIRFMGQAWDGKDIAAMTESRARYHGDEAVRAGVRGGHKSAAAQAGKYDLTGKANRQFQEWTRVWAEEAFRVLKPGGHILCFASTRTYHRMASGIEDAGFEIRDQIGWTFGSGFPKSHNLHGDWEGWGTALKPAWEPICVARKPFKGTVAENMARHRTGAINIAGCRIEGDPVPINRLEKWSGFGQEKRPDYEQEINTLGRWPANLIHDGSDEVLAAFPDSDGQQGFVGARHGDRDTVNCYGDFGPRPDTPVRGDTGSAARFFYCAKASKEDREEGCDLIDTKPLAYGNQAQAEVKRGNLNHSGDSGMNTVKMRGNNHPTVKPTDLMRWLLRLVTPPGGKTLDCFMGSGSTLKAALLEGFDFIGIEKEADYCAIAKARAEHVIATDMPLLRQGAI